MKMTTILKHQKVVYFADPMLSMASETMEEEFETIVGSALKAKGLVFENVKCIDTPPFGKLSYDILFFDWGGMSIGNSLMESFCRGILKEAQDKPNTYYVMVSTITKYAMQDALEDFPIELHNVFLDINKFADFYKTYEIKK